ncbi:MAG: 2-oxo acid dehydrogenase subunit E2 [Eubacteriales bacterium]|nr:2-oxo acid dehydrogenase subunit E2 [Eubacteriales bacterium]
MALFFKRNRSDGKQVSGGDPLNYIMPYLIRSRVEAQVYSTYTIQLDAIDAFIRENRRQGRRITFFNVLVAALLKTIAERPRLNRFIAGRRIYEHKNFEVLYVVKAEMSEAGNESVAKVSFDYEDTIYEVSEKMAASTQQVKSGELKNDDKFIRLLLRMPRWAIRSIFATYRWLDFHGMAPQAGIESFPFYSSVFVSHLGTLGGNAAYHHLYEMGTTSIFLTIGSPTEVPIRGDDDQLEWSKQIDLAFNVDERICDGYYLVKSLRLFQRYMNDPWLLEYEGININVQRSEGLKRFMAKKAELRQARLAEEESKREAEFERRLAAVLGSESASKWYRAMAGSATAGHERLSTEIELPGTSPEQSREEQSLR